VPRVVTSAHSLRLDLPIQYYASYIG
jgi:hypothetical protein